MPAPAADPLTATRSELALLCATLGGASSTRIEKFVLSFFDTQLLSAVATREKGYVEAMTRAYRGELARATRATRAQLTSAERSMARQERWTLCARS